MRVAVLSWRDPRHPEAGGSEVYVEEVARGLVRAGHEVTVITARPPGLPRREVLEGVRHRRSGGRLTVYLHGLWWVALHGRRTDVVVDVINGLPFGTPLVRRRGVVALVHHVHREQWRMIYPGWRGRFGWWVESVVTPWLYRGVRHVTVSGTSRDDLVALGRRPERVDVVRNGLAARARAAHRAPEPRVVVLSRLVPHKQVEHVLDAVAALRAEHPDVRVDVVGRGWWGPQLLEHARSLGVEDLVTFHGWVEADERDRLLARARVLALPSVREGWGIAVTEAAAQGTPAIGYRVSGGLTESVVDGVTGWLVDGPEELTRTLGEVLAGRLDVDAAGEAARERVAELDWGRTAREFEDVLLEVARRGRARPLRVSPGRRR
ncbi:glycosyltransferase family 4 protein [Phycicoccus sp. MQZ13P-5]|uniref:Glycosyltransferase family 4 protein n=1 Tax=Phycicoccus sonneratiae TaxID=2807628 RepID=A0ABS2CHZ2_9MICO|nr:glycosyltransferase family 4 protein [Phycicoccus sonneraticus]